jgi:methylenetetrahydrofolate reductase (NADPH)
LGRGQCSTSAAPDGLFPLDGAADRFGIGYGNGVAGEERVEGAGPFCLGAVASPFADPQEMQLVRLNKKIQAGAQFCITQPVFDLKGFETWWQQVVDRGLQKRAAIMAGIEILTSARAARAAAERHARPTMPDTVLSRITVPDSASAQRVAGIGLAVELVRGLSRLPGLRGFELRGGGDHDAVLEVMARAGLGVA